MRNRIVVWGRNAQEDRVLIAVELIMEQNIVKIQTFTEKDVSDAVYKVFMDQWRKNQECELPEPHKVWARELSVSEGLLPEELKVEQSDMINRAQTEWHYLVLSAKLKDSYRSEIAEINDRVERKGEYDSNLWSQLKTFWEKVQTQLRDKTFLREHGNEIREEVDVVFAKMKEMREKMNEEVKEKSAEAVTLFANKLEAIDKKIEEGTHLRRVFDELRQLQSKFHNTTFSRDDRKMIYDKIDGAFKSVKAKRNGDGNGGNAEADSAANRTKARYDGLMKAMEKMQRSIGRDEKDLEFENRRIANTNGQLEAEMRKAKIKMIDARIISKREKLDDMEKTKTMLEGRMKKHEQRKVKDAKRKAEREAAAAVKAKHAAEMKAKKADMSAEETAKLAAAAAAIKAGKQKGKPENATPAKEENAIIAAAVAVSAIVSGTPDAAPVMETPPVVAAEVPAVVPVEVIKAAAETPSAVVVPTPEVVVEEEKSFLESAGDFIESATEKLTDVVEDVVDTAKAVAEVAGNKLSEAVEEIKEEVKEMTGEEE